MRLLLALAFIAFALMGSYPTESPSAKNTGVTPAQSSLRLLYSSDWTGLMEIFAADP